MTKNRVELGELHDNEVDLIYLIRTKYRFGQVVIQTHDGVPKYVEKTIERERLGVINKD